MFFVFMFLLLASLYYTFTPLFFQNQQKNEYKGGFNLFLFVDILSDDHHLLYA